MLAFRVSVPCHFYKSSWLREHVHLMLVCLEGSVYIPFAISAIYANVRD